MQLQETIQIPERVEQAIGYEAWTALSWALHNQWVQDYKWLFSEMTKSDVGTPRTVQTMLHLSDLMRATGQFYTFSEEADRPKNQKIGTRGLLMFTHRVKPHQAQEFYKLMVEGYLLGTDFVSPLWVMKPNGRGKLQDLEQTGLVQDAHGLNQLEGELRRYWARKNGIIQPQDAVLTRRVIDDFVQTYKLNGLSDRLAEKLNL
ncbi:hypothetical protein HYY71_02445 [Candidatus Woesearchaeota archaeon]|nr:hypothetical protein [Candidatus Woesearchaeota archaeon]